MRIIEGTYGVVCEYSTYCAAYYNFFKYFINSLQEQSNNEWVNTNFLEPFNISLTNDYGICLINTHTQTLPKIVILDEAKAVEFLIKWL